MNKKALYSYSISFLLLITVIVINRVNFDRMKEFTYWISHTHEVITSFEQLSNHFKSAEIYTPAFKNSQADNFYTLYKKDIDRLPGELVALKVLISDNPKQVWLTQQLSSMIEKHLKLLSQSNITEIIATGDMWRLNEFYRIHNLINQGITNEKELLQKRKAELEKYTHNTSLLTALFFIIAVAIIITTFFSNVLLTRKHKWLEGFLESVLNTSQNGIVTYKAIREEGKIVDFKIEFANAAIENLMGVKPETILKKKVTEVESFLIAPGLMEKYISVVETGTQLEFEAEYKRGSIKNHLIVILARLHDGLTATFHNINNLKRYEEELKNKIRQLEASNMELEQYAYVASHDLQEPLRKIKTYGSFLKDGGYKYDTEKEKSYLDKIIQSADRMSVLIKDLLNFSSLKREVSFVQTDLNQIVSNVLEDLDLLITQKEAMITAGTLPVIEAIPLQMNQLFYNLLNNALKFSMPGVQPIITITCTKVSDDAVKQRKDLSPGIAYLEIIVRDNGVGFNQDDSEQIFGLFRRLNNKQFFPGSGIGLALCRKVVANHNGDLYAEGMEGKGAAFHIILPFENASTPGIQQG